MLLKSYPTQLYMSITKLMFKSIPARLLSVIWDTGSPISPLTGLARDPSPSTRLGSDAGPQGPAAQEWPRHGLEQDQSPLGRMSWARYANGALPRGRSGLLGRRMRGAPGGHPASPRGSPSQDAWRS